MSTVSVSVFDSPLVATSEVETWPAESRDASGVLVMI
jgi:hypothetical protein